MPEDMVGSPQSVSKRRQTEDATEDVDDVDDSSVEEEGAFKLTLRRPVTRVVNISKIPDLWEPLDTGEVYRLDLTGNHTLPTNHDDGKPFRIENWVRLQVWVFVCSKIVTVADCV